jgi:hypothetical protein
MTSHLGGLRHRCSEISARRTYQPSTGGLPGLYGGKFSTKTPGGHSHQMDPQSVAKALEAFSAEVLAGRPASTSMSVKSQKPAPQRITANQGKKA